MTTSAPRRDEPHSLEELDEREQRAWTTYKDSLRDLTGKDYEDAEHRSWDRLQRKLRELDEAREDLTGPRASDSPTRR
jgi:hypothetical protein